MAQTDPDRSEVNARILYWGPMDAGKSTNLRAIHARLRPDHRGPLEEVPTRLDPSVTYERLGIELGQIAGQRTRIQIMAVPGAPEHGMTRKQLLDRVDGIVFVVDATPERVDDNLASFDELRSALGAYGRRLEDIPLVIQYNKRDTADPFSLEELHRKLDAGNAAVFEAVASEGTGVLQTLTTISKRVVRALRDPNRAREAAPSPPTPDAPPEEMLATPEPRLELPQEPPLPSEPPSIAAPLAERDAGNDDAGDRDAYGAAAFSDPTTAVLEPREAANDPDVVASRARAMLDTSWGEIDSDPVTVTSDAWVVADVGSAAITGPRSISLPLVISDETGRELRFELNLSLEPADTD